MQRKTSRSLAVGAAALLACTVAAAAHAQQATVATAGAFGATITAGGQDVVPPTPQVSVQLGESASETLIDIPADPLAVSGTLIATAAAEADATLGTSLTVNQQEVAGPYNAVGVGLVEDLAVLTEAATGSVTLLSAEVVRAEAVAACQGTEAVYGANSEIVDLRIGGEPVPLNEPVEQLIDGVNQVLTESGLDQVVNVERNVVTQLDGGGIAVDALVVTLLAAAGDAPLAQVRIAHGEVSALDCQAIQPSVEEPPPVLAETGTATPRLLAVGGLLAVAALALVATRRRST